MKNIPTPLYQYELPEHQDGYLSYPNRILLHEIISRISRPILTAWLHRDGIIHKHGLEVTLASSSRNQEKWFENIAKASGRNIFRTKLTSDSFEILIANSESEINSLLKRYLEVDILIYQIIEL